MQFQLLGHGLVLCAYIIIGGIVFHFLESDNEEDTVNDAQLFTKAFQGKH